MRIFFRHTKEVTGALEMAQLEVIIFKLHLESCFCWKTFSFITSGLFQLSNKSTQPIFMVRTETNFVWWRQANIICSQAYKPTKVSRSTNLLMMWMYSFVRLSLSYLKISEKSLGLTVNSVQLWASATSPGVRVFSPRGRLAANQMRQRGVPASTQKVFIPECQWLEPNLLPGWSV